MADRLTEARQRLHGNLRSQAHDRVSRLLGSRPAQALHQAGQNAAAAQMWETHHPEAMKLYNQGLRAGGVPAWVRSFLGTQEQPGNVGGHTGAPAPIHGFGGGGPVATGVGAAPAPAPGGNVGGAPTSPFQGVAEHMPATGAASTPFKGGVMEGGFPPSAGLIHLGGGIFVHPETGQIHGLPSSNPLQNALRSVSPGGGVPTPAPVPAPVAL